MEIVRVVGKEIREYTARDTGELRQYAGLHVVYEVEDGSDVEGKRCADFSCPREVAVSGIQLGQCYELQYAHFKTKNGTGARICGLIPVDDKTWKRLV